MKLHFYKLRFNEYQKDFMRSSEVKMELIIRDFFQGIPELCDEAGLSKYIHTHRYKFEINPTVWKCTEMKNQRSTDDDFIRRNIWQC